MAKALNDRSVLSSCRKKYLVKIPVNEEIKATDLKPEIKLKFCNILLKEAAKAKFFKIFSITCRKEGVTSKIFREDSNTLYNYMTKIGIIEKVSEHSKLKLIADQRVTNVELRYPFDSYLKTELAGSYNSNAEIEIQHKSSHSCKKIQCADIVTHLFWRKFEFKDSAYLEKISHLVVSKNFFF